MKKIFSKTILMFSMIFLAAGICFFPNGGMEKNNVSADTSAPKAASVVSGEWGNGAEMLMGGSGTAESPYLISTNLDLAAFAKLVNDGNYQIYGTLTANINLGGKIWTPIGKAGVYAGVFNGSGFEISGVTIDSTISLTDAGLFGQAGNGAVIANLRVTNTYINNAATNKGNIVAKASGGLHLISCSNAGDNSGFKAIGVSSGASSTLTSSTCVIAGNSISAGSGEFHTGNLLTLSANAGVFTGGYTNIVRAYINGKPANAYNITFPCASADLTQKFSFNKWPENPSKSGYEFTGYTGANYTGDQTINSTDALTWEAQYIITSWTLTFDKNADDASLSLTSKTIYYGKTYGDTIWPTPTRNGYKFEGWYTASSGGIKVEASTSVPSANPHTSLYAAWSARTIKVSLNPNGGNFSGSTAAKIINVTFGSKYGEALVSPTRVGFDFLGWFTAKEDGKEVTTDTTFNDNPYEEEAGKGKTLYARWAVKTVKLTFKSMAEGAADGVDFPAYYDEKSDIRVLNTKADYTTEFGSGGWTEPTRPGFHFAGYYIGGTGETGGTRIYSDTFITDYNADYVDKYTLVCRWEKVTNNALTISKHASGESNFTGDLNQFATISLKINGVAASGTPGIAPGSILANFKTTDVIEVTIAPNTGYELKGVTFVKGTGYPKLGTGCNDVLTTSDGGVYTFKYIVGAGDIQVSLLRNVIKYTVKLSTPNGSIEIASLGDPNKDYYKEISKTQTSVNFETKVQSQLSIKITPNVGYHIVSASASDGTALGSVINQNWTYYTGVGTGKKVASAANDTLTVLSATTFTYTIAANNQVFKGTLKFPTEVPGAGFKKPTLQFYLSTDDGATYNSQGTAVESGTVTFKTGTGSGKILLVLKCGSAYEFDDKTSLNLGGLGIGDGLVPGSSKGWVIENYSDLEGAVKNFTVGLKLKLYTAEAVAKVQNLTLNGYIDSPGLLNVSVSTASGLKYGDVVKFSTSLVGTHADAKGFVFLGWFDGNVNKSSSVNYSVSIDKSYSLEARWIRKVVDVSLTEAVLFMNSSFIQVTNFDLMGTSSREHFYVVYGSNTVYLTRSENGVLSGAISASAFMQETQLGYELKGWAYKDGKTFKWLGGAPNNTLADFSWALHGAALSDVFTLLQAAAPGASIFYPVYAPQEYNLHYVSGDATLDTDIDGNDENDYTEDKDSITGTDSSQKIHFNIFELFDQKWLTANNPSDAFLGIYEIANNAFIRAGYTFREWVINGSSIFSEGAEFTVTKDNLASLTTTTAPNAITIMADWNVRNYTIKVNAGSVDVIIDGTNTKISGKGNVTQNLTYRQTFDFSGCNVQFNLQGYTVVGYLYNGITYKDTTDAGNKTIKIHKDKLRVEDVLDGVVDIETTWAASVYDLTLNANGGRFTEVIGTDSDEFIIRSKTKYGGFYLVGNGADGSGSNSNWRIPYRPGFRFAGFYETGILGGTGNSIKAIKQNETVFYFKEDSNNKPEPITLTAIWEWTSSGVGLAIEGNTPPENMEITTNGDVLTGITAGYAGDTQEFLAVENGAFSFVQRYKVDASNIETLTGTGLEGFNLWGNAAGNLSFEFKFLKLEGGVYIEVSRDTLNLTNVWESGKYLCEVVITDKRVGYKSATELAQNLTKTIRSGNIDIKINKAKVQVFPATDYNKTFDGNDKINKTMTLGGIESDVHKATIDTAIRGSVLGIVRIKGETGTDNNCSAYVSSDVGVRNIKFILSFASTSTGDRTFSYAENFEVTADSGYYSVTSYFDGANNVNYQGTINKKKLVLNIGASSGFFTGEKHNVSYSVTNPEDAYFATSLGYVLSGIITTSTAGKENLDTEYQFEQIKEGANISMQAGFDLANLRISHGDITKTGNFDISVNGNYTIRNIANVSIYKYQMALNDTNVYANAVSFIKSITLKDGTDQITLSDGDFKNPDGSYKTNIVYYWTKSSGTSLAFQVTGYRSYQMKVYMTGMVSNIVVATDDAILGGNNVFYAWKEDSEYNTMNASGFFKPQDNLSGLTLSRLEKSIAVSHALGKSDKDFVGIYTDKAMVSFDYGVTEAEKAQLPNFKAILSNGAEIENNLFGEDGSAVSDSMWNPVRTGFRFVGWEVQPKLVAGEKFAFNKGDVYNFGIESQNVLALWELDNFTASIITVGKSYTGIYSGEVSTLICEISNNNSAITYRYIWKQKDVDGNFTITKQTETGNKTGSSTLKLKNVSDSGTYKCFVEAKIGDQPWTSPITTEEGEVTITKRKVTINSNGGNFDKFYDDNTLVDISKLSLTNAENDGFAIEAVLSFSGAYRDRNVAFDASGNVISVEILFTLAGDKNAINNYVVVAPDKTDIVVGNMQYSGKIKQVNLQISLNNKKKYDQTAYKFDYNNIGSALVPALVSGHTLWATFTTKGVKAGIYAEGKIGYSLEITTHKALDAKSQDVSKNYTFDFSGVTLEIEKANLTNITFEAPAAVIYDGQAHQVAIKGTLPSEVSVTYTYKIGSTPLANGKYPIYVGKYMVSAILNVGENYNDLILPEISLDIKARPIVITLEDVKKIYDGNAVINVTNGYSTEYADGTGDYIANSDSISKFVLTANSVLWKERGYTFKKDGNASPDTFTAEIVIKNADDLDVTSNYDIGTMLITGIFKIEKKTINISINANKTYDKTAEGSGTAITLASGSELVSVGANVDTFNGFTFTLNGVNAKTYSLVDVIGYTIEIKNNTLGNVTNCYDIILDSATIIIDKKAIEFGEAISKIYDGTNVTIAGKALTGIIAGDIVSYSGKYASKDAAESIKITEVTLDNLNYTFATEYLNGLYGKILKKNLKISILVDGENYKASFTGSVVTLYVLGFVVAGGIVPNETLAGTLTTDGSSTGVYTADGNAGNKIIPNLTISGNNAKLDNYEIVYEGGISIEKTKVGDIDYNAIQSLKYNGLTQNSSIYITYQLTEDGETFKAVLGSYDINGVSLVLQKWNGTAYEDFNKMESSAGAADGLSNDVVNAGKYKLIVESGENVDFSAATTMKEFVISPKEITISGITKKFDGNYAVNETTAVLEGLVKKNGSSNFDDVFLQDGAIYDDKNVGKGIRISNTILAGVDAGNYILSGEVTGEISKLKITIDIDAGSRKFYDGQFITYAKQNYTTAFGDTFSYTLKIFEKNSGSYDVSLFVDTYEYSITSGNAANYDLVFAGIYIIDKAEIFIAFDKFQSLIYDGTNKAQTITYEARLYNGSGAIMAGEINFTTRLVFVGSDLSETATAEAINAGRYKIYIGLSNETKINYVLKNVDGVNTIENVQLFTVEQKEITLDIQDGLLKKAFGEIDPKLEVVYPTGIGNLDIVVTFNARAQGEKIGFYALSDARTNNSNFKLKISNSANKGFQITASKETLYISLSNFEMTYNANIPAFSSREDGKGHLMFDNMSKKYYVVLAGVRHDVTLSVLNSTPVFESILNGMSGDDLLASFNIRGITKNCGSYTVELSSGISTEFLTIAIKGTLSVTIKQKEINFNGITIQKEFNFETGLDLSRYEGIVNQIYFASGDEVQIIGDFLNERVGNSKVLNVVLSGKDSGNYSLTNVPNTGNITKANVKIELLTNEMIYGTYDPSKTSFKLANGFADGVITFRVLMGGEDITERAFAYIEGYLKIALKADETKFNIGDYLVILDNLTSSEFNFTLNSSILKITKKNLEILGKNNIALDKALAKGYDGNNVVNFDNLKIDGVVFGDDVSVAGIYAGSVPGIHKITFTLNGADSGNYEITGTYLGKIDYVSKTLKFNYNAEGFIDGLSDVTGNGTKELTLSYPFTKDPNSIIGNVSGAAATYPNPNKNGYTFDGWHVGADKVLNNAQGLAYLDGIFITGKELTLVAKWTINENILKVVVLTDEVENKRGGSVNAVIDGNIIEGITQTNVNYFKDYTLRNVTNEGFVFVGFFDIDGKSLGVADYSSKIKSNTTIFAKYRSIGITLNLAIYDQKDSVYGQEYFKTGVNARFIGDMFGFETSGNVAGKKFKFDEAISTLPSVSGTGVGFKFWYYYAADGKTKIQLTNGTLFDIAGKPSNDTSFTVYAEYDRTKFNANFDANGGVFVEGTPTSTEITFLDRLDTAFLDNLKAKVSNKGYDFVGFEDGAGKEFTGAARWAYVKDETFKVKWKERTNIIYVALVGAGDVSIEASGDVSYATIDGRLQVSANTNSRFDIIVKPGSGYAIKEECWIVSEGAMTLAGGTALRKTVSGYLENGKITITLVPRDNFITFSFDKTLVQNIEAVFTAPEDGSFTVDLENGKMIVESKTGKSFYIQITPKAGYTIFEYKFLSGSISLSEDLSTDKSYEKRLLSKYFDDMSMNIVIEPKSNLLLVTNSFIDGKSGGSLTIEGADNTIVNGSIYTLTAKTGKIISVTVKPNAGYFFNGIENVVGFDALVNGNIITISGFTDNGSMTVLYEKETYGVTLSAVYKDESIFVESTKGGTVSLEKDNIVLAGTAKYLDEIKIYSNPKTASGYKFIGWFKDVNGTDPITTTNLQAEMNFVVKGISNIFGIFELNKYTISYTGEAHGKITGSTSQIVSHGKDSVEVKAVPDRGYKFVGWFKNGGDAAISTELTHKEVAVNANVSLVAKFERGEISVNVEAIEKRGGSSSAITEDRAGTVVLVNVGGEISIEEILANLKFYIKGYTGNEITLKATPKLGYTFAGFKITETGVPDGGLNVVEKQRTEITEGGVKIITVTFANFFFGTGYKIEPIFEANDNLFESSFARNGNVINAGQLKITSSNDVTIRDLNNYFKVNFSVLTGGEVFVSIGVKKGFAFDEANPFITSSGAIEIIEGISNGTGELAYIAKIKVRGITEGGKITINVVPENYSVQFINEDELFAERDVEFGALINTSSMSIPTRRDYAFKGWYTNKLGQGNQYVNDKNESVKEWSEHEYEVSGTKKVVKLYASWELLKTKVTLKLTPKDANLGIVDFLTNSNSAWYDDSKKSDAYYEYKVNVEVSAPYLNGYKFVNFKIKKGEESEIVTSESTLSIDHKDVKEMTIEAVYYVRVGVVANEKCGEVTIEGVESDGYYSPENDVTIEAKAKSGYRFIGFKNRNTGAFVEFVTEDGVQRPSKFTFKPTLPVVYDTIFEGENVTINIAKYGERGGISSVLVNGQMVYPNSEGKLDVRVGDEISFVVNAEKGYYFTGFDKDPGVVDGKYIVKTEDLTRPEVLTFTPIFKAIEADVIISKTLNAPDADGNEANKSVIVKINGIDASIVKLGFDDTMVLTLEFGKNYKLSKFTINNVDYSGRVAGGTFVASVKELYAELQSVNLIINVETKRTTWQEVREPFDGSGTKEDPYIIKTEVELAEMAYNVNNKIGNFAEAYYVLSADLNLAGKFWLPIGTELNPFNGIFDFNNKSIGNIELYKEYSEMHFDGVFGAIGDDSEIISTKPTYTTIIIVCSVIGGIIILSFAGYITFREIKRKRRKELEKSLSKDITEGK